MEGHAGYEQEAVSRLSIELQKHFPASGFKWERKVRRLLQRAETFDQLANAFLPMEEDEALGDLREAMRLPRITLPDNKTGR